MNTLQRLVALLAFAAKVLALVSAAVGQPWSCSTVREQVLDGGQPVADHPWTSPAEKALAPVRDGITLDTVEHRVAGCRIFNWRGNGIRYLWTQAHQSNRVAVPLICQNTINHVWTGVLNEAVDTIIANNRISSCRDYGILDKAGAVQSVGNHVYGTDIAIAFGIPWSWPVSAGSSRSIGDTFADCRIGLFAAANRCQVVGAKTEHCSQCNIYGYQTLDVADSTIKVQRASTVAPKITGVYLGGQMSSVTGGKILLNEYLPPGQTPGPLFGTVGIELFSHGARIDTCIIAVDSQPGQIGVLISPRQPLYDMTVDVYVEGFAAGSWGVYVADGALGRNNTISIRSNEGQPWKQFGKHDRRLRKPAGLHVSNKFYLNYSEVPAAEAYPPNAI
jgi:hypothetical protein